MQIRQLLIVGHFEPNLDCSVYTVYKYMYMYAFFILLYISLISESFKFIYIQSTFESSRFFVSPSKSSWVFHCILKFKTTTKRSCYQLRAHQDLAGLLRGPGKKCHRQISFQVLPEEKVKPRLLSVGLVGTTLREVCRRGFPLIRCKSKAAVH